MPLADAHIHLFRQGYASRYGRGWARSDELATYEALRHEHGIECALVVGYEGNPLYRGNNADLAGWVVGRPWLRPLAYVHPGERIPVEVLERRRDQGFVGISLYCPDRSAAEQAAGWSRDCVGWLNRHRFIVSVNAPPAAVEALTPLVRRCDGCVWLFSHLGLPGPRDEPPAPQTARTTLRSLLELAPLGQVGVKVSGLYAACSTSHLYPHLAAQPYIRVLLETFGPQRLYWGSDYSPCLEHVSFAQAVDVLNGLAVTAAEREAIAAGNLLQLLPRPRPPAPMTV